MELPSSSSENVADDLTDSVGISTLPGASSIAASVVRGAGRSPGGVADGVDAVGCDGFGSASSIDFSGPHG
ncbi:hypothetical protein [Streptomyces niveus]|uniref:hypothetical protein n=1 Tax=Streptomyces niveus TaxID=193462 RepID=UPI0034212AEB